MNDFFNRKVYERIKETNQMNKLRHPCCEIEPDYLYMGELYNAVSIILPKDYIVIDFGCYMASQAFLFEDFKEYIGIDLFDKESCSIFYYPPERFTTNNSLHFYSDISHALEIDYTKLSDKIFAIMSAVPDPNNEYTNAILNKFSNAAIWYPGEETICQGVYTDEILKLETALNEAYCPYTRSYIDKHPAAAIHYEEKWEEVKMILMKYKGENI